MFHPKPILPVLSKIRNAQRRRMPFPRGRLILLVTTCGLLATATGSLARAQERFFQTHPHHREPAQLVHHEPSSQQTPLLFSRDQKLREGTLIPPTVGRIVHLGQRWAFVPMHPSLPAIAADTDRSKRSFTSTSQATAAQPGFDRPSGQHPLKRWQQVDGESLGSNPLRRESHAMPSDTPVAAYRDRLESPGSNQENRWQHIILCENQMLQRMVEAVRTDANDDRWEISGEILEFFEDNRLLIHTIQRAGAE